MAKTFVKIVCCVLGILNLIAWGLNFALSLSPDRTGAGMVMMVTLPAAILFSLVSFAVYGWLLWYFDM
jgi:hypothetical protein